MNQHEKQIREAMQRAGDKLVQLGFAERYMVNDVTGEGEITWTARGSAFKRDIQRIYDLTAKDKGESGHIEFLAFIKSMTEF